MTSLVACLLAGRVTWTKYRERLPGKEYLDTIILGTADSGDSGAADRVGFFRGCDKQTVASATHLRL